MRIGMMLRAADEKGGIGVYSRNLLKELLAIDRDNEYVLFFTNDSHFGKYGAYPNVEETVVTAPGKALWDQVAVPRACRRHRVDLVFNPKFTVPLTAPCKTAMVLHGADWFIPELEPGSSMVEGSAVAGRVGKIGGVLGGNPIPEVIDNVVLLGLESNNYYIGHGYREPVNDNADPFDINWNAFNWNDDQRIEIYSESPCHMELTEIFHPAGWLPAPITDQRDMEELAEMLEVYLLHHNLEQGRSLRFFTPLDEPNNRNYEMIGYAQLAATLGRRKNQSPFPQVSDALLLVPGSSQFEEPSSTGAPGQEWAEYCYQLYDADVDGINFHQWGWRNLLNLHRYRTEVEIAHAIIATNDADGDTLETIVIDQTCINSGDGSSPYEVNSFYAALWWAGVVCNALGTGYVDALNWFNTVDDPHHKKGLMYGPDDGYAIKPVGWATRFLIESKLDEVIPTRATHPEVDVLTSVDGGRTRCHLLLVNKGERTNAVTCAISLPSAMPGLYSLEIYALRDGMSYPELVDSSVFAGQTIDIEYTLPPRSIYAFRFDGAPVAIDDRRGPGWEMAPRTGAVWAAPTPFSLSTGIEFAVNRPGMAELRIHDPGGRLVRAIARQITSAGPARIAWDGRDGRRQPVASGIYFYRLRLPSGTVHHGRVMRLR